MSTDPRQQQKTDLDLLMAAWGIIAGVRSVSDADGDGWKSQDPQWRAAATEWREAFYERLRAEVPVEEVVRVAAELRDLHPDRVGYCKTCGGQWPCRTRQLAEQLTGGRHG